MANLHPSSSFVITEAWLSEVVSTKGGKEQTNADLVTGAYQNYLSIVRGHVDELLRWGLHWPEPTHVAGRFSVMLNRGALESMKEAAFPAAVSRHKKSHQKFRMCHKKSHQNFRPRLL